MLSSAGTGGWLWPALTAAIWIMMMIQTAACATWGCPPVPVVTFYEDTSVWSTVQCHSKAQLGDPTPAPEELRIGCVNINGAKTRVKKRSQIAKLHDDHDIMLMCEIGNKAKVLTGDDIAGIVTDITPFGRGWATAHVAMTLSPAMNNTEIEVASALGGRLLRADMRWGDDDISICVVYVPADPSLRPAFLRAISSCLPADRELWLSGDFNCVPNISRDSKHQGTYSNTGCAELTMLTDAFALNDVAEACSAPESPQGWMTFMGNKREGRNYERRLDQIYVTDGILNKTELETFQTRPTGIAGVDHHLLRAGIRQAPRPEADPSKVFPGMRPDIIFVGDFVERVQDLLRTVGNGDCPSADDADGWCSEIDTITREVQDMYVLHKKAVLRQRTPEVREALKALEQFSVDQVASATETYFDEKRALLTKHVAACEAASAAASTSEEVSQRACREQFMASYRNHVQPRSQSGVFTTQKRFIPPHRHRPEQSLEYVIIN